MTEESRSTFDLFLPPLFRTILLKLQESQYEFIFNMHHIITDGWSLEILKRDIFLLYRQYMNPQDAAVEPLEPLSLQYKDFAAWHNKQLVDPLVREQSHRFWKEKLKHGIEIPELPGIFGAQRESKQGAAYQCAIPGDTKNQLYSLARETKGTLFTVLFSFYLILLSRLSGQTGITCSIISAGRKYPSLNQIVGFFINSILFKTRIDHGETYEVFLNRLNREVQETYQHETYPLELVFKDLKMKYPQIPVSFNMLNIGEASGKAELQSFAPYHLENGNDVKFDLEPYVSEYKNGIHMIWAYKKTLFKPFFIEHMANEYLKIMDFFIAGKSKNLNSYVQKEKKRQFSRGKKVIHERS